MPFRGNDMDEYFYLKYILLIVVGFLSGGIMFSRIIPRLLRGTDVCETGKDGNPGAANAFTSCGPVIGMLCLIMDMLKGFIPVFIALKWLDRSSWFFALAMLAPVLGHAIAPLGGFRGGKCIAAVFGDMIALMFFTPVGLGLAVLYIIFSTVLKISPNRRRSIVTFMLFGTLSFVFEIYEGRFPTALGCALVSGVAIWKHMLPHKEAEQEECVKASGLQDESADEAADAHNYSA